MATLLHKGRQKERTDVKHFFHVHIDLNETRHFNASDAGRSKKRYQIQMQK